MQLALPLPEPPAPLQKPAVSIEPQARQTAQDILVRILAQATDTAKPKEVSHE